MNFLKKLSASLASPSNLGRRYILVGVLAGLLPVVARLIAGGSSVLSLLASGLVLGGLGAIVGHFLFSVAKWIAPEGSSEDSRPSSTSANRQLPYFLEDDWLQDEIGYGSAMSHRRNAISPDSERGIYDVGL